MNLPSSFETLEYELPIDLLNKYDSLCLNPAQGILYQWGRFLCVPLHYRKNQLLLPGPVWNDNKCAFDAFLMALIAIRVAIKEESIFDGLRSKGIKIMDSEYPEVSALLESFLTARINCIEFKARALVLFEGIALYDERWRR